MRGFGRGLGTICGAVLAALPASAAQRPKTPPPLTRDAINAAVPDPDPGATGSIDRAAAARAGAARVPDPLIVRVQVLLDRARVSPGAIDGRVGDSLKGALRAYATAQGLPADGRIDRALFDRLLAGGDAPAAVTYTITEDDVRGPFAPIPREMEAQSRLKAMGYTTPREMLAERFHMQRDLLSALNPGADFGRAGTVITVAGVGPLGDGRVEGAPLDPKVVRVEIDKGARRLKAFGADGALVADYPASIGSREKPAPTGTFKATSAAFDPWYRYDPKYRFKGVKARHAFKIPPGPNSPVGAVWIDLSIPSYGIHGTPEPEKVGKTESHGCIRLTNWDARALASHIVRGAEVRFVE